MKETSKRGVYPPPPSGLKGDDRTTVDPSYYIMIAGRTKSVMTVKTAYL